MIGKEWSDLPGGASRANIQDYMFRAQSSASL